MKLFIDLHNGLLAALLAGARVMPAFILLPFLNNSVIFGAARLPVVIMVGLALWPEKMDGLLSIGTLHYIGLLAKETLIGLMLGCALTLPLWILHAMGSIIDNQRGATLSSSISPLTGIDSSELAIVILRRTDSPKVYIFEPRLENPFRVFHSEFDMQSWFINRCADAAERQKIALAFPVAARIKGFVKWGVDQYLQAMGDTQKDPNAYLQYIATDRRPLQGSLAIQLADRQKERDYADLPYEITSHAAIRTARWASYFDVINMIFPNPATLLVSWGMALDQMLNGASWQARKQGAGKFFTYTAFLFTAALDGVAGRALDMGEEWMTASAEGEGGLAGVIRAEAGDLESDYTQLLLAHKLGVEALPPELNVHNRPLRVYPAVENSVKERGIIPAPVEFEQLGPPEENGLLSGLRAGDNDKKYVQIKNQFYEVFYDSEADEYYLGDKNAERLPLFIDEEHKVAFEKPFSAREIQNLPSLCRTRRAPGTSAGVTCSVQISAKARQALDDNIASAIPAEEIDNKLEVFNDRRALFRKKGTEEIYFKYADHYFPTKITNPQGYIANLSLKIKAKTPWKKLLGKSSKLDLWLVPDRQSRSGMTLAMKDEVKEIMLNLKRGGLPIVETYIEQEQTLSREEISAITQYVNSSSNAIREFCVKKKLSGPEVYSVKWLQREAEYALQFIRDVDKVKSTDHPLAVKYLTNLAHYRSFVDFTYRYDDRRHWNIQDLIRAELGKDEQSDQD